MHIAVTAKRLEPAYAGERYSECLASGIVGEGLAGGLNLIGTPTERIALLADWLEAEVVNADLDDLAIVQALKKLLTTLSIELEVAERDLA